MCQFKLLVKLDYGQIKCSLAILLKVTQRIIAELRSVDSVYSNNSHHNKSKNAELGLNLKSGFMLFLCH